MAKLIALVAAAALAVAAPAGPAQDTAVAAKPRVTVIGDSVQASFQFVPRAVRRLGKGFNLRVDAVVCRRLVSSSCSYNGVTPATALEVIRSSGRSLGSVVVINVGYNDDTRGYDVNRVMRALRAAKVETVVWVTLREQRSVYTSTNRSIRLAAKRWKRLVVADWNRVSAGRPWFGSDGLHLNAKGAMALSGLIRQKVLAAT
jgi:lysophospholipase L1-like esterase